MNITGFAARADIVGRRIRIAWDFVPGPGETLANIPPVTLRRKLRDFAYPAAASPDPFLVYDASSFPPAPVPGVLTVTDLDGWEAVRNGERFDYQPVSVAVAAVGRFVEVLRCTTVLVFDLNGAVLRQGIEIIDTGMRPGALQPNQTYYYQLFSHDLPASGGDAALYQSSAMATDSYGQNRVLYQSLPEVYRRHDVVTRAAAPGQDSVPELAAGFGQLRRFLDPFGIAADSLRGTADGLPTLHDINNVDARFLPQIAQWIGWDLTVGTEIPLLRNELKTANRLYALVGTLPGLRTLVTQFTGWFTQVAEFAQNIAQSNQPPHRNLFAITTGTGGIGWHGVDDAAELLGFVAGNQQAAGVAGAAASLTGTLAEPFALRPGMSLTLGVDGLLPASVRLGASDFADITQATAAELAAAINRALPEAQAQANGGRLTIASDTVGAQSLLQVIEQPTSLVSLVGAPAGRLSPVTDSTGRIRLFYETWETPTTPAAEATQVGTTAAMESGNQALPRVRYKTFVDDAWRDSQPLFPQTVTPQADPAAVVLPDQRIWTAWFDNPRTAQAGLSYVLGAAATPVAAQLVGQKNEPFALTDGAVLTLTGHWTGPDTYTVHTADFADLTQSSAAELVAAMNTQLTQATAARQQNGTITLVSKAAGALATLAIDLSRSTTARAIGFDSRNAVGTAGSWSDVIGWTAALDAVSVCPGRYAELAAVADPAGGVRLAWASHRAGLWRIETAHWNDRVLVATANGGFVRDGAGAWAALAGLPSPDIRAIQVDANGTAWIASAAGVTLRHQDGTLVPLTPALPSPDVRDLALGADGTAWIATAAGLVVLAPDGTLTTLDTGTGLPSDDVRAVAVTADGTVWAATAAGAVQRTPNGNLTTVSSPLLPSSSVQGLAVDAPDTVYFATAAGLAMLPAGGTVTVVNASNGLTSADVRAVAVGADGAVWVATAGGVGHRSPAGTWTVIDTAGGLPSSDIRNVSLGPDGTVWVSTAAGISTITPDATVGSIDLLGGGTNPAGRAVHTGWSARLELANGGGGNREPALTIDQTGRTWLAWAQRIGVGTTEDSWGLHARICDPATPGWGADLVLTSPPVGGRAADRTPAMQSLPASMRIYFASDRGGGSSLWSTSVSAAGVAAAPVALPQTGASDFAPASVTVGSATWLVFRGDANISLAQTGSLPSSNSAAGSVRVPDNGAVRRYAGSVAADLSDLNRLRTRRVFGDMLSYTPNRPDNVGTLTDDELYTRGTVGLYVSSASPDADMTDAEVGRLRELLQRFIPINLRALVIVVEPAALEIVFALPIADSFSDDYPFVSTLGPITDSAAAAIAGLAVLISNRLGNVSADPANLVTLQHRSFFQSLQ